MDAKTAAENLTLAQRKASAAAIAQILADANVVLFQSLAEIVAKTAADTSTDYTAALTAKSVAYAAYWTNGEISAAAFNAAAAAVPVALSAKTAAAAALVIANANLAAKVSVATAAVAIADRIARDVVLALKVVEDTKSLYEIAHRCGVMV